MVDVAAPSPPPIIEPGRVALLFVAVAVIVWWAHCLVTPAAAETIGFRIEAQACHGKDCRTLVSPRRWTGRYACQNRAADIERFGLPGLRLTFKARCTAIDGMPNA